MPAPTPPEVERQALALLERLADRPDNARLRARLLRGVPEAVRARLAALEDSARAAAATFPTVFDDLSPEGSRVSPGTRIGAFRLAAPIGRGGMGEVWSAERDDGLFDQKVAIKLIDRKASPRLIAAFDAERRFLARLEHPGIARLIDGGVSADGVPWLAMEYCDGVAVDELPDTLPLAARVRVMVKAADAIRYAHGRMIAHADIKPSNILATEAGQVKLLDFGIAALIDGGARSTVSGPLTRAFASPERIAGGGPSVADDIYALGRTLAAVTAGRPDAELAAIADKASARDAADRYPSVDALIGDLDRWLANRPVGAMAGGWRYRAGKFVDRNRRLVLAAGVLLVLLGAISVFATTSYFRAEVARGRAEERSSDVRQLAHYMLFDLYDQLARQPGTVSKREQVAEVAARYLDQLQADRAAAPAVRLDAARSYRRLATIEGHPRYSNLGQPERAAASLARARALLDALIRADPRNVAALAERGWVNLDGWAMGGDSAETGRLLDAAARDFAAALAIAPADASARLGLVGIANARGYDLVYSDARYAQAMAVVRAGLTRVRAQGWPPAQARQARELEITLLQRLGDAIYYNGDIPGSLPAYREADAVIDRMIAAQGATPQAVIDKAQSAFNLSGVLADMGGRRREALTIAGDGIARLEALLRAGPDSGAEKRLLMLYGQQALLYDQLGDLPAALAASQAGVALREARLARGPGFPQNRRDLAIGLMPHAELLARMDRRAEACPTARRAAALWHGLRDQHQLGDRDREQEMPRAERDERAFCG